MVNNEVEQWLREADDLMREARNGNLSREGIQAKSAQAAACAVAGGTDKALEHRPSQGFRYPWAIVFDRQQTPSSAAHNGGFDLRPPWGVAYRVFDEVDC